MLPPPSDFAYTSAKIQALVSTAAPIFLAFCAGHIIIKAALATLTGRHWTTKEGYSGTGWTAYNIVVLVFDLLTVGVGLRALMDGDMASISATPHDRIHGDVVSPAASTLCALTCAFELYNSLVCSILFPQGAALIGHHVVTFGLAFIGAAPYVPFYAIFFFGLANLSSVPLVAFTLCDALRSQYPAFETPLVVNQGLFAILFLLVRVGVWPLISVVYWADTYVAASEGWIHSYPATTILLLSNVFLTGLQFMWGRKVWRKLTRVLKGGDNSSHSSSKPISKPGEKLGRSMPQKSLDAYPVHTD